MRIQMWEALATFVCLKLPMPNKLWAFVGFCSPKIVLKVSEIFLQNPPLAAAGRLSSCLQPSVGAPRANGPPGRPQHPAGSAPHPIPCTAAHLPLRAGLWPGFRTRTLAEARGSGSRGRAGPGGAAQRTWARRQVGRVAWTGTRPRAGEERQAWAGPAGGGQVLGARRAASAATALGPPPPSARDELHPEKGLLQAGRQQDRLGAAQDLRVPDAHRQRGLWLRVVRHPLPRACATRGRRGRPGHRARPLVGAQAPGRGRGLR